MARPLLQVDIPHTENKKEGGKSFVSYVITVQNTSDLWTVSRRYNQFYELNSKLKDKFPGVELPPLPPKAIFGNDDPKFIENRRVKLQKYIQDLVKDERFFGPELAAFLELPSTPPSNPVPAAAVPTPSNGNLRSSSSNATTPAQQWQLTIPAPSKSMTARIPELLILDRGDECFLVPLLVGLKDCLDYIEQLCVTLDRLRGNVAAQLDQLESSRARRTSTISTLREQVALLQRVVRLGGASNARLDGDILGYIQQCIGQSQFAMEWAVHIDEVVLREVEAGSATSTPAPSAPPAPEAYHEAETSQPQPSTATTTAATTPSRATPSCPPGEASGGGLFQTRSVDIRTRLRDYEEQAEKLILLGLSGSEVQGCLNKLSLLRKRTKQELDAVESGDERVEGVRDEVIQRLARLVDYIEENRQLVERLGTLRAEEQLAEMEGRMYRLLDDVKAVPKDDVDRATEFHARVHKLMKEMQAFHEVLRKRGDETYLVNQLEDLQENLADFEHEFSNNYKLARGLNDKAKELFKERQLKEARKLHMLADHDMFEL